MLITRRSDYAIRICRALRDGKLHNVREICETEDIPKAFAYKIIRELEQEGVVRSERGNQGGYYLAYSLNDLTIYDIIKATEDDISIVHCMKEDCCRNTDDLPCNVHRELERVQEILMQELKGKSIAEIIDGDAAV